ncbi:Ionotropic receptor 246 [Frankliniella occidentalis]|nr:Ionotropic receptor 246 [Frankliniella occidentalis]
MTTGRTAVSAIFLFLAVRGASGNAVTVLKYRAERNPEVPCALTLIPPLFQRADNDSAAYAPRLFVLGKADWLDEFLRRFPSVAAIYVFTMTEENILKDFFGTEMMPSASVVLRLADATHVEVTVPVRVRLIHWTSFDSNAEADDVMSVLSVVITCKTFFRVMVTARPRGTTHVFSVPNSCDLTKPPFSRVEGELLGIWSRDAGWSAPLVPLFPPFCATWRPRPAGEPLLAEMFHLGINNDTAPVENYAHSEAYKILRLLKDSYGLVFQVQVNLTTDIAMPFRASESCHLDALAFPDIPLPLGVAFHTELSVFPWKFDKALCVVPVGAGKPRSVLYPITAEYTPAVWAALAAVVLAVVAFLYLLGRDESVKELVLQTLSPLLGQPLDDRRTGPQIAVLGGWLLTCVVVVGGYQGQLLGFITVPPQNGEINSWQDWLDSDLILLVEDRFQVSEAIALGYYGLTEDRIVRNTAANRIHRTINHRNVSYFTSEYAYEVIRNEWEAVSERDKEAIRQIHTFELPQSVLQSIFVTTKGSPFEVPLRKILGRIHAAGGLRKHWNYNEHPPEDTIDKPISLINLRPVIVAYIAGNIFAVFTFLLEFLQ